MNIFANENGNSQFMCLRCLNKYKSETLYNNHIDQCQNHKPSKPIFKKEEYLTYKKYYQKNKVPFVIYAELCNL